MRGTMDRWFLKERGGREGKTRQDKTRQDKTRQDKTRQESKDLGWKMPVEVGSKGCV